MTAAAYSPGAPTVAVHVGGVRPGWERVASLSPLTHPSPCQEYVGVCPDATATSAGLIVNGAGVMVSVPAA